MGKQLHLSSKDKIMVPKWISTLIAGSALYVCIDAHSANPVPDKTGPFVAYCTSHFADCKNEVRVTDIATMATFLFTNTAAEPCTIPKGIDIDTGTKEILTWMGKNKNADAMTTTDGIQAAEKELWHCQRQIGDGTVPGGIPAKTGAFIAYCSTHNVACANEMVAVSVSVIINPDAPDYCSLPAGLKTQAISDAVLGWLGKHEETYGLDTDAGIKVAFKHLWSCH